MTTPFRYPDRPHQRLHGPRGYASYESYRPWLRDEFAFRCVYCLTREAWGPFTGVYALDHFVAAAIRPGLRHRYDNLLYACVSCNLIKGSRRTPDPTAVLLAPRLHVTADGVLHADSPEAARLIDLVGLNRPRLREFRELWIRIVQSATALLQRHAQAHQSWLAGHVTPLHQAATDALARLSALGWAVSGDPVASQAQALRMVYGEVQRQALALSYLDLFRLFGSAMLAVIPLVLLMRRSVATGKAVAAH